MKNRKALIDTFIYRVVLYDDKMKVLFNLKSGQKNELLLNLIFPDYPDGNSENGSETEQSAKEKETENSVSSSGCFYTPRLVKRIIANKNIVIFKVNNAELFCQVELPLSDYPLYGKQIAAS